MPINRNKINKNSINKKHNIKTDFSGNNDAKKSPQDESSNKTPATPRTYLKKAQIMKSRKTYDLSGVKRLYSPFNRFTFNKPQQANAKVFEKGIKHPYNTYQHAGLSPKEKNYVISSCQTRTTRYRALKSLALKAIEGHKIFSILGNCNAVRQALCERGWVEKIPGHGMSMARIKNGTYNTKSKIHNELEKLLLSNLVSKYPSNFIWRTKEEISQFVEMPKDCKFIENKLMTNALWTTKEGLCLSIKRNCWFYIEDVSEVTFPRSYNTCDISEVDDFARDFKITACTSLLKWVISMVSNNRPVFGNSGRMSMNVIAFALNRCKEYLYIKQNRDIDRTLNNISSKQWNSFLRKYYRIIRGDEIFQPNRENKLKLYLDYAKCLLRKMYRFRPQLFCEGCHNIWIIKPAHNSRGRGIRMASNLNVIADLIDKANSKYVIQKYIEDPLLIHETKFDIRQYYLITSTFPLVIWMYKDCYLKFSSQKYNLKNYHESIHLTNNAVQRKYNNCKQRHSELPQYNMWDLSEYKNYLKKIDKEQVWDNSIYPGMKKAIIAIMLSCQDALGTCRNKFELYGCDFILDKMYKPWLIEINSCPDLNHTTPVTAKICPAVVADIIKVVIDYEDNRCAPTGKFECIYRQPMTTPIYGSTADMFVRGYTLPVDYFYRGEIPPTLSYNHDIGSIAKINNPQNLWAKLKENSDIDTIMTEPGVCFNDAFKAMRCDSPVPEKKSESQHSIATTTLMAQLESLMDKTVKGNSDIVKSKALFYTQTESFETLVSNSWVSSEGLILQEDSNSIQHLLFTHQDDESIVKDNNVVINDYTQIKTE